ncbi:MAG: VWA domain-containing protein [Actinomycetes bacterium]
MPKELVLRKQDLFTNPTARIAVCLVLDRSPSMSGDPTLGAPTLQVNPRPIDELNSGVKQLFDELREDPITLHSAEIAAVAFSGDAHAITDFQSLSRTTTPRVEIDQGYGGTSLGSGVSLALDLLEQRKQEYVQSGVDYYQPWIIIMTDGYPTDNSHFPAAERTQLLTAKRKLVVFSVAVGIAADLNVLAMFATADRPPMRMRSMAFKPFFEWLSQSVHRVSQSAPGDGVPLPPTDAWRDPTSPDGDWKDV